MSETGSRMTMDDAIAPYEGVVLKAEQLGKTYAEGSMKTPVFDGLEFSVEAGETVAILGASLPVAANVFIRERRIEWTFSSSHANILLGSNMPSSSFWPRSRQLEASLEDLRLCSTFIDRAIIKLGITEAASCVS